MAVLLLFFSLVDGSNMAARITLMTEKMSGNPGIEYDSNLLTRSGISAWCVYESVKSIPEEKCRLHGVYRAAWLLRAVSCIDLTTLSSDDSRSNVVTLCRKALKPLKQSLLDDLGFECYEPFTTAAVCVYPSRISDAVSVISGSEHVEIATVAAGFPSGQYDLEVRLLDIKRACNSGATEIDVVIDRSLALTGKWWLLYEELKKMKEACMGRPMKTILATGELSTFQNIYKASMVAMMAGSDFIKTSTGKESVNATLPVGLVMLRAIREYHRVTGYKVGFKAAGGIRTADDALNWLLLVKREMGNDWMNKKLFRIGASGLLADIESNLYRLVGELA